MAETKLHIWEIRNPDGGQSGLEVARARMEPHDDVIGHALPERVDIEIYDENRTLVAMGSDLSSELSSPMARLRIRGRKVERENVWPDESDLETPVILPGGEVGILKSWWHADDHSAWRWTIELSNHT
jgi:hypothetical protein